MRYLLLVILSLSACATMETGSRQQIAINTNPIGSQCVLKRAGETIGEITAPGVIEVSKTKNDIIIHCYKKGFEDAEITNHSGLEGATIGSIIAGGLIGWGIDSATGADNKYQSPVNLTLQKK